MSLNAEFKLWSGAKTYVDVYEIDQISPLTAESATNFDVQWEEGIVATEVWFKSGRAVIMQTSAAEILKAMRPECPLDRCPVDRDDPTNGG